MSTEYAGVIEPPPGVEPNFVDPPSQQRGNVALHTACLTLATASVVMRLYTRTHVSRVALGVDDCELRQYLQALVTANDLTIDLCVASNVSYDPMLQYVG